MNVTSPLSPLTSETMLIPLDKGRMNVCCCAPAFYFDSALLLVGAIPQNDTVTSVENTTKFGVFVSPSRATH